MPATGTFWKHLARQIAMSGQALAQSGMAGFSCGQHGMSSAIAAVERLSGSHVAVLAEQHVDQVPRSGRWRDTNSTSARAP